ncbi:MAG: response regulator [Elusimicrobia bacterium]|jgi:CheY-like chemotaxis protein|nr:response regulator [Elusimicrobiota bacterium]
MKSPVIWAIEDSLEMQKTLVEIFSRLGCDVLVFGNAEEALGKLTAGARPDVMILDFRLPGMSGPQLFRKMGMDAKLKSIPVVPFTSQSGEETPSSLASEWELVELTIAKEAPVESTIVKKYDGDDFTIPERLILSVANVLKSSPSGLPKIFEDAVMELVNRVMAHLKTK